MVNLQIAKKIADQAITEISVARTHKQGKISNWQKNEDMYYGKKMTMLEARSNVQLSRMQEFVHTLLSKIDNPLVFKFTKRKNSQLKRVQMLNALRQQDQNTDDWDIKDIAGKKQGIIYGRAIYFYYADSIDKVYQAHLENTDVYDFLIDPDAGGIDIEKAMYMGRFSVVKTKKQLKDGKKSKMYYPTIVDELIQAGGGEEMTQEQTNKLSRTYGQNTIGKKDTQSKSKYKFWEWLTTYEEDGERYYILMDNSGNPLRCEKLVDMFPPTKYYPLGAWPVWTWAAFPDLTEFWTPSYCDYAREVFMAQDVSINQMLDNAEQINKPQKVVNVAAIEDLADLKYRRNGIIKTKGDFDANRAVQVITTPSINTPIEVFNILESIQNRTTGVSDAMAGVADENGKVGIYEGNQAATADRFGLLNKSYSFGYQRFARLYEAGVRLHLVKKVAVDMIGPDGVEVKEIKKSDVFKKGDEFGVLVEASNSELMASEVEKKAKSDFLQRQVLNKDVNQKKRFEMEALIAGVTEDEVKELLDTSFYGNSELMSECDRDIECLLEGEDIKPNSAANNAYKQKVVDYLRDHEEDISMEQFLRITDYVALLDPIIMKNEVRALNNEILNMDTPQPADATQQGNEPALPNSPGGLPLQNNANL